MPRLSIIVLIVLMASAAHAGWVGESTFGGTLNPLGLCEETSLAWRIHHADTNTFLLKEAHLDLGGVLAVYPVGANVSLRASWSPLLFLDVGVAAGIHLTWSLYEFTAPAGKYGRDVLDTMSSGSGVFPYASAFLTLKGKVGPIALALSATVERWAADRWWLYWYPEIIHRDGWLLYHSGYLVFDAAAAWKLYLVQHYLHSTDSRETRYAVGPGAAWEFQPRHTAILAVEYHVLSRNYEGVVLTAAWNFAWGK